MANDPNSAVGNPGDAWGPVWPPGQRAMGPRRTSPGPESDPPGAQDAWRYILASALLFLLVAAMNLDPTLGSNEWLYLLQPRSMADPSFPGWEPSASGSPTTAFWWLGAGLFLLLDDHLLVAMVGRILGWVFVLFALVRLSRTLGLGPWAFLLGVAFWLLAGQSLMAGEWIFRGFEQKVFAYGFLFLAVTALLEGKGFLTGLYLGLAISFHVLVGGWAALALAVAALASLRELGLRRVLAFAGTAALVGSPFLYLALRSQGGDVAPASLGSAGPPEGFDAFSFIVRFRNPHHLDPGFFFTLKRGVLLAVVVGFVGLVTWHARKPGRARVLLAFLAVVAGLFLAGLLARPAQLYSLLYVYPFRLGDVLLPLFFWLLGLEFLRRVASYFFHTRGPSRRKGGLPRLAMVLALALFLTGGLEMARDMVPNFRRQSGIVLDGWRNRLSGERASFDAMAQWIRENTPEDAVVASSPCRGDLPLKAGRRMLVSFKAGPSPSSAYQWYQRLVTLNGGMEFREVGAGICPQLEKNFARLDSAALLRLRDSMGVSHYLVTTERTDLAREPVHREGAFRLYDLRTLEET